MPDTAQPPSGRMPMPDTNTVLMPPAQVDDGPKSLGDVSGWARFLGKMTVEKLLAFGICVLAGVLVWHLIEQSKETAISTSAYQKERDANQLRVFQEENERNRQTSETTAKMIHADSQALVKEMTKLESEVRELKAAINGWRLGKTGTEETIGPRDICEPPSWWERLLPQDRAVPDANLPVHRGGAWLSVVHDLCDTARNL